MNEHDLMGKALGRIASGLYILTVGRDGKFNAMLASWVQQAGFEPPTISLAIAKDRPHGAIIKSTRKFALSILGKEDGAMMKRYARGFAMDEDPFVGVKTLLVPSGLPVLADVLGYLDCSVINSCEFGADHELILARVTAGMLLKDGQAFSHQRGNGFRY